MNEFAKNCLCCGKAVKGRSDKKFCDDYCRNSYNNQQKAKTNHSSYVRNINNALLKNRRILETLKYNKDSHIRIHKEKLSLLGFCFKYITHLFTNKEGKTYFWCYDYGYLPLDHDWYLIVRKKED